MNRNVCVYHRMITDSTEKRIIMTPYVLCLGCGESKCAWNASSYEGKRVEYKVPTMMKQEFTDPSKTEQFMDTHNRRCAHRYDAIAPLYTGFCKKSERPIIPTPTPKYKKTKKSVGGSKAVTAKPDAPKPSSDRSDDGHTARETIRNTMAATFTDVFDKWDLEFMTAEDFEDEEQYEEWKEDLWADHQMQRGLTLDEMIQRVKRFMDTKDKALANNLVIRKRAEAAMAAKHAEEIKQLESELFRLRGELTVLNNRI